jgi:hypothetical protein
MTISSETRVAGPFTGNGITQDFPFSFKVFSAGDLRVEIVDTAGAVTLLALTSDYTVALNANQESNPGGTVSTYAMLDSGWTLTITTDMPLLQPVALTSYGGFFPEVINDALDRVTIQMQQLKEAISDTVGPAGPPGANGSGVPAGGDARQLLIKNSATDGDVGWSSTTLLGYSGVNFGNAYSLGNVNISSENNVVIGEYAASRNYFGTVNESVMIGAFAGNALDAALNVPVGRCVFIGYDAGDHNSGNNNIAIGYASGGYSTGSNNIAIGACDTMWAVSNSVTIGGGTGATSEADTVKLYAGAGVVRLKVNATGLYVNGSLVSGGGGSGTVTSVNLTAPAAGITASGGPITASGSITLALANDLAAVEGLAATGIVRRTATDTWSAGTAVGLTTEVTGTLPVANGGTGVTTSTGSGAGVLSTSPTLVTPVLGTPTSGTLTNCTGLPVGGITGTLPVANGGTGATTSTGSGSGVHATSPTLVTPLLVTPLLGTPTSGVLTNCTGLPLTTGVTGNLPVANLAGGSGASGTTYWCGNGTWATPAGGGGSVPDYLIHNLAGVL